MTPCNRRPPLVIILNPNYNRKLDRVAGTGDVDPSMDEPVQLSDEGEQRWRRRRHGLGAEPNRNAKRVLCMDGGGIRGILPAMVVAELERRTGRRACELFDLIAGTSTGGIIAMGLVMPGPDGTPAFSASDGVAIYADQGPLIFSRDHRSMLHSVGGILHERYQAEGLEDVLRRTFGKARLGEALADVLVASYDIGRRETFIFSSRRARRDPDHDFPMWEAVRATTAAPTFFPPVQLIDPGGTSRTLIDGAVYANSPALCAFGEIEREHFGSDVVLVSVGAGAHTTNFLYEDVKDWGAAHWARPLLEIVLDGSAQTNDHVLGELLGPERYFRFQCRLTEASEALDDVHPSNLAALRREGERLIAASDEAIDRLCGLLVR